MVAAVALHETLAPHRHPREIGDDELQIKWPNDLLAGPAKLAGILLERAGDAVVVGIGANLAHHPESLDRPVTSLLVLTGTAPDPSLIAAQLAGHFATWLARWRDEGLAPIRAAWLDRAHPLGTRLITSEGEGRFAGLDDSGALRLALPDGSERFIHAGDVFLFS